MKKYINYILIAIIAGLLIYVLFFQKTEIIIPVDVSEYNNTIDSLNCRIKADSVRKQELEDSAIIFKDQITTLESQLLYIKQISNEKIDSIRMLNADGTIVLLSRNLSQENTD